MRGKRFALLATLVIWASGCAPTAIHWRDEAHLTFIRIEQDAAARRHPAEVRNIEELLVRAETLMQNDDAESADESFRLALSKGKFLESTLSAEEQRHKEEALGRIEQERQEMELRRAREEEERRRARELAELKVREKAEAALQAKKKLEKPKPPRERSLPGFHTVKRGETLPQIAAQADIYTDASLWPLIYRANRDQISNPRHVWPGQVLKIPRNSTREEISEAHHFSQEKRMY